MSELKTNLEAILQEKQTKILPENIKKDVQIFDVIGTLEPGEPTSAGVKLFETEEEMQADVTAKEGDLAVIYRSESQNMTADTQTQYITFPETVTLPEAFTDSVSVMIRAVDESQMFDGDIRLSKSMFRFNGYSETGMIRATYTSDDGISYTREEFIGADGELTNPVDLGTIVKFDMVEEWNDALGYFMKVDGSAFNGLFEYKALTKLDNCITLTDVLDNVLYILPATNPEEYSDKKDFLHVLYLIKSVKLRGKIKNVLVYEPMDYCILYNANAISGTTGDNVHTLLQDNNGCYVGGDEYKELDSTHNDEIGLVIEKYVNSTLSDKSVFTKKELFDKRIKIGINNTNWSYCKYEFDILQDYDLTAVGSYSLSRTYNSDVFEFGTNSTSKTSKCVYDGVFNADVTPKMTYIETATEIVNYTSYVIAPNQYTLTSSNQLLPNISAYGKNGNITGDDSSFDWLNIPTDLTKNYFGITDWEDCLDINTSKNIVPITIFTNVNTEISSNLNKMYLTEEDYNTLKHKYPDADLSDISMYDILIYPINAKVDPSYEIPNTENLPYCYYMDDRAMNYTYIMFTDRLMKNKTFVRMPYYVDYAMMRGNNQFICFTNDELTIVDIDGTLHTLDGFAIGGTSQMTNAMFSENMQYLYFGVRQRNMGY